ncbi:lipopolysaccharide transport periplasmic protein LptA [Geotalea uraniireducens]|uniref:OstA family protein n=1 Tax=Geotalea uraniireducens (strain Rf4) TaxID=351605 RepID=A5G5S8_GEOUR|nr:lipopolysaccharide transport periplasmic protein LptA [Geotalea uraniireducens]ABQ27146.1 OstA family protein [Geotalea uraniireducens Rf4]
MIKKCILAIVLSLTLAGVVLAAGKSGGDRNAQPIKIKSNELFTDNNNRTATFVGKVSARQGDMTIYSDKLVINYSEKDKDVEKVEAFGNVRVVQGNRQALAGHALYENKAGKIVLDTSPKVYQGDDVVSGKVITYFVDEQKSVVTGGGDARVEAVIHPMDKGKDGSAKP